MGVIGCVYGCVVVFDFVFGRCRGGPERRAGGVERSDHDPEASCAGAVSGGGFWGTNQAGEGGLVGGVLVKGSAATLRCCRVVLEQRARGAERSQCELRKDGEQRLLLLAWVVGCAGAGAPTRFWWRAAGRKGFVAVRLRHQSSHLEVTLNGCVLRPADEHRACPGAAQIRRGQPCWPASAGRAV